MIIMPYGWPWPIAAAHRPGRLLAPHKYLQLVLGNSPLQAGARTVPIAAGLLAGLVLGIRPPGSWASSWSSRAACCWPPAASAMNDTARLVGATFGVAIMGTTISEVYAARIGAAAAHLPAPAAAPVRGSLQAALKVAQLLGGPQGHALRAAARQAFTDAMSRAAFIGAGVALAAAVVALVLLPARAPGHAAGS